MKDPQAEIHMAIALAIRHAKRQLFKRHREGMDLDEAINLFNDELSTKLPCVETEAIARNNGESVEQGECYACHATGNLIDDGESVVNKGEREYICTDCKEQRDLDIARRRKEAEKRESIETLARKAVCEHDDMDQQLALVTLLDELSFESNLALAARQAAFRESSALFDLAIEKLTKV